MNFTKSVHPRSKGHMVWKRNANTSQTNRVTANVNPKKVRLASESSDYSCFPETQNNIIINPTIPKTSTNQKGEWHQVKSLVKYSTIASRMQLKKTVPISFTDGSVRKNSIKDKKISTSKSKTFSRVIDTNGNITKSFKQSNQFKSINPHIQKDVDKVKVKTFNMYKKQKKKMDNFLVLDETTDHSSIRDDKINARCKSLYMDYGNNLQMQKISQRQQYESRKNSTRCNAKLNDTNLKNNLQTNELLKKQANKYAQEQTPNFSKNGKRSSVYEQVLSKKSTKSGISFAANNNNLLKGLLGQYSNYQKLTKHELIQKLISLEYLAQNIFKKNKYLQQQMDRKQSYIKSLQNNNKVTYQNNNKNQLNNKVNIKNGYNKQMNNKNILVNNNVLDSENRFVINNEDGYFNQFLQSQKDKQQQLLVDFQLIQKQYQPERFKQQSSNQ